jgi:chemotaxis protein MotB
MTRRMAKAGFSFEESGVVLERPIARRAPAPAPPGERGGGRDAARESGRAARGSRPAPAGGRRRGGLRAALPWLLLFSALGGGAGLGLWGHQQQGLLLDRAERAEEEARSLGDKAARLEGEVLALGADLKRSQAELAAARVTTAVALGGFEEAERRLSKVVTAERGEVTRERDRLTLELVDDLLFRSGEAELTDRGRVVLLEIGETLNAFPDKQIWVQGHTDDVPMKKTPGVRFGSNWELSAARALTVVHYLQEDALVEPRRLAAVAFGEHRPRSNKKFKNRRIEIVLAPAKVELKK